MRAGEHDEKAQDSVAESMVEAQKAQALANLNQKDKTELTMDDLSRSQRKKIENQAEFVQGVLCCTLL